MPQADGTVLIDTEINADGMEAGTKEVEAAARRMAESVDNIGTKAKAALNKQVDSFVKLNQEYAAQAKKVDELRQKVEAYGNQKIPTEEYSEIQKQISQAEQQMMKLINAQERFVATGGKEDSSAYKRRQYDIEELANTIKYAEEELKDLEESGKAFTFGANTKEASADMNRLAEAERRLSDMNNRLGTSYSSIKGKVNDYQKSILKTDSTQKKFNKTLKGTNKHAKKAQMSMGRMLATSILFSFVFQAISAVMSGVREGFENLAKYSKSTNRSLSMLMSSLTRLKNSFATAFAPILDVVAPILSRFIDMISKAATAVGQLMSALTGKNTFIQAIAVQEDYASSLEDSASAAKDAEKAMDGYLSPLDEINKYTSAKSISESGTAGEAGTSPGQMFEEVPIDSKFLRFAEKIKKILGEIFKPFKESWEREGQSTIDSAKYALSGLGNLAKSVGSSILEVWSNGTGAQILSTILQIAQGILVTIGNIAIKLSEAWNTNRVGTQIIQAIANSFQVILDFINRIVIATANWAANINFYPLLESIKNLLVSLSLVLEGIGNFLAGIYESIILPIGTALIETILPAIINALSGLFSFLGENQWIIESIGAALLGAFAASKIVPLITTIVTAIKGIITALGSKGLIGAISSVVKVMGGPLTLAITAAIAIITLLITHWEDVKKAMQNFDNWLQGVFSKDWTETFGVIGDVLNGFFSGFKQIWEGIKETFNGIITFITGVFSGDWKKAWEGIKQIFGGIFESLVGLVKTPINTIIGIINGLISGVTSGINAVIRALNSINFTVPSWVPVLGGKSFGFNLSQITAPKIPFLATGAVIPPNAPFMAVLGDQKRGNNIEAPESLIRKIVREESGSKGFSGTIRIPITLNGRQIFEAVIDEAKLKQMISGRNPFEMA